MPKIKVSFIGLGRVFNHYLFIIKKFNLKKYIEIDCLCDQDEKLIKKFKKKIKGKFYTSIKIFLDNCTSDVVFILTPSGLHYEHSLQAIKKNFNVITEKPIAMTSFEAI